jgi:hypothetical protein
VANWRGVTLERIAQGAALLALCAALIACATLFFPWHTVDRVAPRAVRFMFQLADPGGARLREEIPERHDFVTCTGLDHLAIGGWPIVILLAGALLAGFVWRAKTRRGNVWVSLGSVIMGVVFAWLGLIVPIWSHVFETEGPRRLAEKVFGAALTAAAFSFVLSAALRVALLVVRRPRTRR